MASRLFGDKKANIRRAIILVLTAGFLVFLYFFNQVEIVPLTNREGVSYEKARVIRVLQDNLQQDGTRAGSQTVEVELLSGDMKGEVVQAQSLSGYLYGADCTLSLIHI